VAKEAMRLAAHKLSIKCKYVERAGASESRAAAL
jgi:ribosomal protein L16/L10AE